MQQHCHSSGGRLHQQSVPQLCTLVWDSLHPPHPLALHSIYRTNPIVCVPLPRLLTRVMTYVPGGRYSVPSASMVVNARSNAAVSSVTPSPTAPKVSFMSAMAGSVGTSLSPYMYPA